MMTKQQMVTRIVSLEVSSEQLEEDLRELNKKLEPLFKEKHHHTVSSVKKKVAPLMPRCKATTQVTVYKGVGGKQCKRRSKPGITRCLCYQHDAMRKACRDNVKGRSGV